MSWKVDESHQTVISGPPKYRLASETSSLDGDKFCSALNVNCAYYTQHLQSSPNKRGNKAKEYFYI